MEINLEDFFDDIEDGVEIENEPVSLWIKDKDLFVPSTDISIHKELPPGIYKIESSNQRGVYCKEIKIDSDELFIFSDSIIQNLINEINLFWDKADLYKQNNLIHKRGVLLYGHSGTGKSSSITLLSKEIIKRNGIVFRLNSPKEFLDYLDFIKFGFRKIQPLTPIITILEDIDQYDQIESQLLDFLDGQYHSNNHLVISTTNNTEDIPDTVLRPSRMDLKIEIGLPSNKTREEFFRFKNVPEDKINPLVKATKDCSIADLKEIYICHFILDYDIDFSVNRVKDPTIKRDYTYNTKGSVLGL